MNVILNNLKIDNIYFKNNKNKNKILYNLDGILLIGIPLSIKYESFIKLKHNDILVKLDNQSYEKLFNIEKYLIHNYNILPFIYLKSIKIKKYKDLNIINNTLYIKINHIDIHSKRAQIYFI